MGATSNRYEMKPTWGIRFGPLSSLIYPQMGQIRDFFRSDLSTFGAGRQNVLKYDLKKSRICPIWG